MRTIIPALIIICMAYCPSLARDPDLPPPEHYGEPETIGGSRWTSGDTFVLVGITTIAVMLFALPSIFDGEYRDWPVYKFRLHLLLDVNKFPTRQLCGSY